MTGTCWKIAFVLPSMPGGGLEVSMLRIASYLKKIGHQVSMLTTEEPGAWFDRVEATGLSALHVGGLQGLPHAHARRVGRLLRDEGFDVIFPVFDRFSQAALGMLPDSAIVIPLLRNDHPDTYEIGLANSCTWNVAVANSPRNADAAKGLVPHRPVVLIPNGVEPPQDVASRSISAPSLGLLYVGRLVHESKGVLLLPDILMGAAERGIDCTLTVAGDGVDREVLERRFEQRSLKNKVTFTGMVGRDEVFSLLSSSHVLLFTSFYEGLPNVVLEAQAHGCIPIATLLPGVTDFVVKNGETGYLVAPNDVLGFVDSIEKIHKDREQASKMADKAASFMKEEFSNEREGSRYLTLIEQAMDGQYPLTRPRSLSPCLDSNLFPKKYIQKKRKTILKQHLPDWLLQVFRGMKRLTHSAR